MIYASKRLPTMMANSALYPLASIRSRHAPSTSDPTNIMRTNFIAVSYQTIDPFRQPVLGVAGDEAAYLPLSDALNRGCYRSAP